MGDLGKNLLHYNPRRSHKKIKGFVNRHALLTHTGVWFLCKVRVFILQLSLTVSMISQ